MKIRPLLYYILNRVFSKISRLVPKDDRIIMFISTPDFSDNPRYLYERARKILRGYKFVWLVTDKTKFRDLELRDDSTVFVQYRTFECLKWMLKAKYLVLSHGVPYWKSGNQIAILLWHGLPLKTIGKYVVSQSSSHKYRFGTRSMKFVNYFITTSEFLNVIFGSCFELPLRVFLPLGQPRCDAIFTPKSKSMSTLSNLLDINPANYAGVVMYFPTFRDYSPDATLQITLDIINNSRFKNFLSQNNLLFLMKPHPHDEKLFKKYESDYIKIIKNKDLLTCLLTLYDILPAVDVLVTDYSSIYFDYLLLNRPIVFYIPDLRKYRETRGFLLEPYEKWTPGDKARTIDELICALDKAINNPKKWEMERLWLRDVMFKYQDEKSSERIIEYFWK